MGSVPERARFSQLLEYVWEGAGHGAIIIQVPSLLLSLFLSLCIQVPSPLLSLFVALYLCRAE